LIEKIDRKKRLLGIIKTAISASSDLNVSGLLVQKLPF